MVQMDRISLRRGVVAVHFISSPQSILQGVAFQSDKGAIKLSDGSGVKRVYIWHEMDLSPIIRHEVECPNRELKLWNVYKATTNPDRTIADAWTNNAGMIVQEISKERRRYYCSDGVGDFSKQDLVFEIEIELE